MIMNIKQEIFDVFGHAPHQYPELSIISLNEAEFYTIMDKINYRPKLVLETGTASGCSALLLMQYAKRVITFDVIEVPMKYDIWKHFGVLDKITSYIIKDTSEISALIDEEFDFAFVDSDHTYEGCSKDISVVEECGRILFHDVYHPPIIKAINELRERNPGNYIQCGGTFGYWSNK